MKRIAPGYYTATVNNHEVVVRRFETEVAEYSDGWVFEFDGKGPEDVYATKREAVAAATAMVVASTEYVAEIREVQHQAEQWRNGDGWNILCAVSGGVTGFREGLYKEHGFVRFFFTKDEAKQMAKQLNQRTMNCSHNAIVVPSEPQ